MGRHKNEGYIAIIAVVLALLLLLIIFGVVYLFPRTPYVRDPDVVRPVAFVEESFTLLFVNGYSKILMI